MEVIVDLETINVGTVGNIGVFLLALLFATFATLDILKITNFSKHLKMSPEKMLIASVPLFIVQDLGALGNAISEFWGDVLPVFAFLFFIAIAIIGRRERKAGTHNKSLNTDASDAGAG
jgi:hypothetical protein